MAFIAELARLGNSKGVDMPVQIIHTELPFEGAGARAERIVFDFLKQLPDGYVIRECRISSPASKRSQGSLEDRPDFVVIHPQLGVVALEVKDWDIYGNRFEYLDDWFVWKTDKNGKVEKLRNPYAQADDYLHALRRSAEITTRLWVSSFVIYPRLTRSEFTNRMIGYQKNNPQQHFIYEEERTLFADDLDLYRDNPLALLKRFVDIDLKRHQREEVTYTEEQVTALAKYLIPSEMQIGGLSDDRRAIEQLVLLDERQQAWACSDALKDKNYLSDVAGSGKTNTLLSRAIHLTKQHLPTGGCLILVVTYSKALKLELERIFRAKFTGNIDQSNGVYDYCRESIRIYDIVSLMEEIVKGCIGEKAFAAWKSHCLSSHTQLEYIEALLPEKCFDLPNDYQKRLQRFDYLLIDEIQDFNTWFMDITLSLLKDRNNLFMVGDVGQKFFDRELDLGEFDIVKERAEIHSRYLMYRSPRPIAKLAWEFLISDNRTKQILQDEGYKTAIKPMSPITQNPVFISSVTEEVLLEQVCDGIQKILYTASPRQILCIGLKEKGRLKKLSQRLQQPNISTRWATEDSSSVGDYVILADYLDCKGLERDYVFILDADLLAQPAGLAVSPRQDRKDKMRDRIKLFVALTRAMREVRLYYIDHQHTFIRELLQIWATIERLPWKSL
jgi:Nuclease-related domain/AAA domain